MRTNKTKNEKYAEKWFKENGFDFELVKQYVSKTKYKITKDGITIPFELIWGVDDIKGYMRMFNESFEMKKQLGIV